MAQIQAEPPENLYRQARLLVEHGWFRDEGDLLREALRKSLDTHRPELMERFIRENVEWGLRGNDRGAAPCARRILARRWRAAFTNARAVVPGPRTGTVIQQTLAMRSASP